ncbi:MFS-type transporter SLC18B1-like isoform X2 [Watersipora subatra]
MPVPDPSDKQVDTVYLILAIILRISQAMGSSAVFTAAMTCLTISFTEQTTTILSYSETVAGLGFMSGPAFGSGLYKAGGFLLVFTGVGGMLIVTSVVIGILLPEAGGSMDTGNSKSALKLLMHNLNILLALLLTAFIGTLWASIETILEPELRTKYGLTQDLSALVFLILSVTYTITAPLVGKALDKLSCLNSLYVMVFGFLLHTVNFLFMGPSPMLGIERPLWLLLLTLGILGIALGLTIVPSLDLLSFSDTESENAEGNGGMDESSKALISGFWSSAYSFGDFFGPTFSGIVTRHGSFGLTMTYYAIGCFAVAVIIILCVFYRLFSKRCHSCISSSYRESNDERRQLLHPESVN